MMHFTYVLPLNCWSIHYTIHFLTEKNGAKVSAVDRMGSKRHGVDLNHQINNDISESFVGLKEFKDYLETPSDPTVNKSNSWYNFSEEIH